MCGFSQKPLAKGQREVMCESARCFSLLPARSVPGGTPLFQLCPLFVCKQRTKQTYGISVFVWGE